MVDVPKVFSMIVCNTSQNIFIDYYRMLDHGLLNVLEGPGWILYTQMWCVSEVFTKEIYQTTYWFFSMAI